MLEAVKIIQRATRRFLRVRRIHWSKVRAALLVQAVFRGYKLRQKREDVVEYLAVKREERAKRNSNMPFASSMERLFSSTSLSSN